MWYGLVATSPKPLHGVEDRHYPDQVVGALRGRSRGDAPLVCLWTHRGQLLAPLPAWDSLGQLQGVRVVGWCSFTAPASLNPHPGVSNPEPACYCLIQAEQAGLDPGPLLAFG
jgi:hypothetical protein